MALIENLQSATTNATNIQNYLSDNFEEVYDFFNYEKHSSLIRSKQKIYQYILFSRDIIEELDINNKTNLAFISLLLDVSEQLGLLSPFRFLYEHLKQSKYNIGERLYAASLYLIGINTIDDYLAKYDLICNRLQVSYETEEDNVDKVIMTFSNYYALVIKDFGEFNVEKVLLLKSKIKNSCTQNEYSFLKHSIVNEILEVNVNSFSAAFELIHSILDSFLGRKISKTIFKNEFLFESKTKYSNLLQNTKASFSTIRQISVNEYQSINSDSVFRSLGRGVTILTEENQLFAYMNSYGSMHYEKLVDSFKSLPKHFFEKETSLIDWGCGQAIASMTYFDFLNNNRIEQEINNISLVEPSEIALKRASLHIKKFTASAEIQTINKDLDSLVNGDFINKKSVCKLHLLSNILDINHFSLTYFSQLIDSNFAGTNYFICVSPYINDMRTSRLDAFVKHFSNKNNFEELKSIDNKRGEWKNNWTRVVRIFKVTL
jgi:hypothetical protein